MHTQAPAASLYHPLPHTHKQKYFMLLSQGYLFCVCVCVFTPLVIPVPMVSVALERRVISSFWGVAHWDPGGVQRRGERKMRKQKAELLELFRTAHPCTSPRNSRLHVSDVAVHFVKYVPQPLHLPLGLHHCPCSTFLCLFHFVSGSYH